MGIPTSVSGNNYKSETFMKHYVSYDKARQIKTAQDAFCANAQAGKWDATGEFPEDYQWEALVDVLRGRVKVRSLCNIISCQLVDTMFL